MRNCLANMKLRQVSDQSITTKGAFKAQKSRILLICLKEDVAALMQEAISNRDIYRGQGRIFIQFIHHSGNGVLAVLASCA